MRDETASRSTTIRWNPRRQSPLSWRTTFTKRWNASELRLHYQPQFECATGAIVGVGSADRLSAVRWNVARRVVWAWVLTIPGSALVAMMTYWVVEVFN